MPTTPVTDRSRPSPVVYVDYDPMMLVQAARCSPAPQGTCTYVDAGLRDPTRILGQAKCTLDPASQWPCSRSRVAPDPWRNSAQPGPMLLAGDIRHERRLNPPQKRGPLARSGRRWACDPRRAQRPRCGFPAASTTSRLRSSGPRGGRRSADRPERKPHGPCWPWLISGGSWLALPVRAENVVDGPDQRGCLPAVRS